ncbi:MAG: helix-turn-helix domain-containing protein [Sedimentibacter sp.]
MKYLTTKQASELWNISQRRVAILCDKGRITGVEKAGKTWLIPKDASKPSDLRRKVEIENDN